MACAGEVTLGGRRNSLGPPGTGRGRGTTARCRLGGGVQKPAPTRFGVHGAPLSPPPRETFRGAPKAQWS